MREVAEQRRRAAPDAARRAELVGMLVAGGIFRLGATVVGTQAFTCYANLLGVRFERVSTRTQDVDLAQERSVGIALAPEPPAEPGFFAVPELDPRSPSTSFKVARP